MKAIDTLYISRSIKENKKKINRIRTSSFDFDTIIFGEPPAPHPFHFGYDKNAVLEFFI
jgi:hypothetical protein